MKRIQEQTVTPSHRQLSRRWLIIAIVLGVLISATQSLGAELDIAKSELESLRKRVLAGPANTEMLRQELLTFRTRYPGTTLAVEAARLLGRLPSPMDGLRRSAIPKLERFDWQPKELVAVAGEHRGRHGVAVTRVRYHPKGTVLATGTRGGDVRFWEPQTLRQQARLNLSGTITGLEFTSDGNTLAACTSAGNLYLMDLTGKKPVVRTRSHVASSAVHALAIRPDDKALACSAGDNHVHTFSLKGAKGKVVARLSDPEGAVRGVAFTEDGSVLLACGNDGTIHRWDARANTYKPLPSLMVKGMKFVSMRMAPGGRMLATGMSDGTLWLWTVSGLRLSRRRVVKVNAGGQLDFSSNGRVLAVGGSTVTLIDTAAGRVWNRINGYLMQKVTCAAFSPDGKTLAGGGTDCLVRLWDRWGTRTPQERYEPKGHLSAARIALAANGVRLGSVSGGGGTMRSWDLTGEQPVQKALYKHGYVGTIALTFAPDHHTLLGTTNKGSLLSWDVEQRGRAETIRGGGGIGLSFTGDGKLVFASDRKSLYLWQVADGVQVATTDAHENRILSARLSPDGKLALTGTGTYLREDGKLVIKDGKRVLTDCTVRLWDMSTGTLKQSIKDLPTFISRVAFTPDSQRALYVSAGPTLHLWDLEDKTPLPKALIEGRKRSLGALLFSPDGRHLLTTGSRESITLWDPQTGKRQHGWNFQEGISSLAFSPDCRYLCIGLRTGPVYVVRLAELPRPESKVRPAPGSGQPR